MSGSDWIFPSKDSQAVAELVQRGCVVSVLEELQAVTGQGPEQP